MTDQEIVALGPAFAGYLTRYRDCFLQKRTAGHFDSYCRGLLSDLPRKSVEPIALACGTAVRTLQEFLVTADWGHETAREKLQRRMAEVLDALPEDPLGTVWWTPLEFRRNSPRQSSVVRYPGQTSETRRARP